MSTTEMSTTDKDPPPGQPEASPYRRFLAKSLHEQSEAVADRWLQKLKNVVMEPTEDIFPTVEFLDHIPLLIRELAHFLGTGGQVPGMLDSMVTSKAIELGQLRYAQDATVSQLLREYDLLAQVLEEFVEEKTVEWDGEPGHEEVIGAMSSVSLMVRSILQSTVDAFVSLYSDTIRTQTEKLASYNSIVTHELKSPLQAALLNCELLTSSLPADNDTAADVQQIQRSVERMGEMLANLEQLTLAEDTEAAANLVNKHVDFTMMLQDIGEEMDDELNERDIELTIDDDLGGTVTDVAKLRMVFSNLISNAVKYSDPDKPRRRIKVSRHSSSSESRLSIAIVDNGLGINSGLLERVLKLRVRGHASMDEDHRVSGHGVGLFLVTETLDKLGGTLTLTSEAGEWTRAVVELPGQPVG